MSKVIFKFDKEKDLQNIWETCNFKSDWYDFKKNLHPIYLEMCEGKGFEVCRSKILEH